MIEDSTEIAIPDPAPKRKRGCIGDVLLIVMLLAFLSFVFGDAAFVFILDNPSEAKWSKAQVQMVEIGKALNVYSIDHDGNYPNSLSDLHEAFPNGVPLDPFTKAEFDYVLVDDKFTITCLGKDGAEGGKEVPQRDIVVNNDGCVGYE